MRKCAILFVIALCGLNFYAQTEPVDLEVGKQIEKEIAAGQSHSYNLTLKASQFVHAVVLQKGVDVTALFYGPDGARIAEFDNPGGPQGSDIVHLNTQPAGVYRLEIKAKENNAKAGSYTLLLDLVRDSNPADETRIRAEKALWFGQYAYNQQKSESYENGLIKLAEALDLYRQIGDKRGMSVTYETFGDIYGVMGKFDLAVENFNQCLAITRENKNRAREALMLNKLGGIHTNFRYNRKAKDYFLDAAAIYQELGNTASYLQNLNNAGIFYAGTGENLKAIETYTEIIKTLREQKINQPTIEVSALLNLSAYTSRRNLKKSKEYLDEALTLVRKLNNRNMLTRVYSHFVTYYQTVRDFPQAIEYVNQMMALWNDDPKRAERQTSANQMLGQIYLSQKDNGPALEKFTKAKDLLDENPYLQARAISGIGKVYAANKEYAEALKYLNEALKVFVRFEDKASEIETSLLIADIEKKLGNPQAAVDRFEKVLTLFEKQRAQFSNQEIRAAFSMSIQPAYQLYIESLMQLQAGNPAGNYAARALEVNERSRARSLLEQLIESRVDFRKGVDPGLLGREKELSEMILAKAQSLTDLVIRRSRVEQINAVKKEIEDLQFEYSSVQEKIRVASPAFAALTQPVPSSLKEIQQQILDPETALLEYALGREKSFLFIVTKDSLQTFELPNRSAIEDQARAYFDALTARNKKVKFETAIEKQARIVKADADLAGLSHSLSEMILAPLGALPKKRLLIVADGALQYIPFASLAFKDKQPLTANYEIVSLPSASTLAVLRKELAGRQPAPKTIAVIADPVFDIADERFRKTGPVNQITSAAKTRFVELDEAVEDLSEPDANLEPGFNFLRLPFTRREAEAISGLAPPAVRKLALDFSANRANATGPDLAQYRMIHFATHSFLNSRHPELSGIVLSLLDEEGKSQNGFLRADEIYNLNLPAELVVLSGCRTGLGKEIRGEGLGGMTRGFMYAGARRVAVSLWDVNDEATAELMTRFYREMLGPKKLAPAAAMREAQLSMFKDKRWSNPYYWAGFILQGEPGR